jgi:hypothetical protein
MTTKSTRQSRSVPDVLGLPCALLSLASGVVGLAMALALWWRTLPHDIDRIGDQAGLFSAAVGLALASIAIASTRKSARRIGIIALLVNITILSFVLDNIFLFTR